MSAYIVTQAAIPKKPNVNRRDDPHVISKDFLNPPLGPGLYWTVKPDDLIAWKEVIIRALKQKWHKDGLEPFDEILWHDGEKHLIGISVCVKKGSFQPNEKNAVQTKFDPDQARKILLDSLEKWQFKPQTIQNDPHSPLLVP